MGLSTRCETDGAFALSTIVASSSALGNDAQPVYGTDDVDGAQPPFEKAFALEQKMEPLLCRQVLVHSRGANFPKTFGTSTLFLSRLWKYLWWMWTFWRPRKHRVPWSRGCIFAWTNQNGRPTKDRASNRRRPQLLCHIGLWSRPWRGNRKWHLDPLEAHSNGKAGASAPQARV